MSNWKSFLAEHQSVTRRHFVQIGAGALAAGSWARNLLAEPAAGEKPAAPLIKLPALPKVGGDPAKFVPSMLTPQGTFYDVSRGEPVPHGLPEEKKAEVGMTRDTWRLEVISDPEHPVKLGKPMTKADNTAFDFAALMQLAETHAVRFTKVMTCLNIGCPLGFGLWEGVPLREVIWRAEPRDNLRRVFYYGYHNDDPKQMFRSSLPIGRVFEDPFDLPPVILCYKLNGQWLTLERGGPVRVVVPEAYGFKSIKWLSTLVLTNLFHANDTYAEQNNDIDSPLKTFASTIQVPRQLKAGEPVAITGFAQVGQAGLSKVQAWIQKDGEKLSGDDKYYATAPWVDMQILGPPENWGAELPEGKLPLPVHGFESSGQPKHWPLRFGLAHWAGTLPGLSPGKYVLRSRAVDEKGFGQPNPRPFRKSGHAAIEQINLTVT